MKIAMVAGGSGGHIYPALALAEGLKEKGHDITFIGSNDRMEKDVIPQNGFDYIGLDVVTTRGSIIQKIKSILSIVKAYFRCLKLLKGYDLAIGFGNYISIPVMMAAVKLKIKTIIHEQNSFVGRANRILDRKVDLIIGCYEENKKQFANPNIRILGNPQSSKAYNLEKDPKVIEELGLDPNKKTVVIFMGSLGSSSVNKKLLDYFKLLDGSYQVVFATGASHYEKMLSEVKQNDYLKVFERIDGVNVMNNADLLICRAGATTLSEICAIGIASILIPSPYVPNNHQYYNGKALVDKDAAVMIEEKDLSGDKLNDTVNALINDDERLKEISANALKLGNPEVLNDIINEVENI
ncbi:MAG: undecaprenyldiphospho-muramoylpentapeptide beta-N-acetylglucosaminyltransferase [Erysipelotrichaceae bacterium]|nr:undecaprenyldiphospho-muramoylpentapeptide beta-N-acetylglucosaminyltransferase [Erysipelotrichaceae bacterium]